ncbi:MAG: hypothetical protein ABSC08_05725 [Bryobacteraceae bacterium]|jgi:hypothetical protein
MGEKNLCGLCDLRPSRRLCPSLHKEICAVCCGTGREETIDCPLDCEYLRDARRHEKLPPLDPKTLPNPEIELSDQFMNEHQQLAIVLGRLLLIAAVETPGAVDLDMREALEAIVKTYKTAESGLIYESRPANAIAARAADRFTLELQRFREDVVKRSASHTIRDKDILGVLAFWQRMEYQRSNGRRKGRAFIESLYALLPPPPDEGVSQGGLVATG